MLLPARCSLLREGAMGEASGYPLLLKSGAACPQGLTSFFLLREFLTARI